MPGIIFNIHSTLTYKENSRDKDSPAFRKTQALVQELANQKAGHILLVVFNTLNVEFFMAPFDNSSKCVLFYHTN